MTGFTSSWYFERHRLLPQSMGAVWLQHLPLHGLDLSMHPWPWQYVWNQLQVVVAPAVIGLGKTMVESSSGLTVLIVKWPFIFNLHNFSFLYRMLLSRIECMDGQIGHWTLSRNLSIIWLLPQSLPRNWVKYILLTWNIKMTPFQKNIFYLKWIFISCSKLIRNEEK